MTRRSFITTSMICFAALIAAAVYVWADCHDTADCEDMLNDLIHPHFWDEDYDVVYYKVNNYNYMGRPNLTPDVDNAAAEWSDIQWKGTTLDIAFRNDGTTNKGVNTGDGTNTLCYGPCGGQNDPTLAQVHTRIKTGTHQILEQDVEFNYYKGFKNHGYPGHGWYCIQNVATHEFGHMIKLQDLKPAMGCTAVYQWYTMWHRAGTDEHRKEDIMCEEKWCVDYKY